MNIRAFSFVELIIVISILALLSVTAVTINTNLKTKLFNTRSIADIETLRNAFESYAQENSTLPDPSGNTNWFTQDTSYTERGHSLAFGVYGQVTSDTLPKKYLNILPLDQFTGAYYAYGKTLGENQFEIAGIIREQSTTRSIVEGNYTAENGPYNLIREYNGPNFVHDGSTKYFPYNPDELALNARIYELDFNTYNVDQVFEQGDTIDVPAGKSMTLYFADGSKSVLGGAQASTLVLDELSYPDGNSLVSKISLVLRAGTIWTNATQTGKNSQFNIQAGDTTAAVRGTIFGVQANGSVEVISGIVNVSQNGTTPIVLTSDHPNNGRVPSTNDKIKQGAGELIETLNTEVIRYDSTDKKLTLKMFATFAYDADYLQAGTQRIINPKDGTWTAPLQDFVLTDTNSIIELKFCKQNPATLTVICTRETSIPSSLSFDLELDEERLEGIASCTPESGDGVRGRLSNHLYTLTENFKRFVLLQHNDTDIQGNTKHYTIKANCITDPWGGKTIAFEDERLSRVVCNQAEDYSLNASQTGCDKLLTQCDFNGTQYSDTQTVFGFKYETSTTCSEKALKTCDGLTGSFNNPLYTHGACNKWCEPPTGWLNLSGQTKLGHGQANNGVIYKDNVVGNSTVRFTRNAIAGNVCQDGDIAFSPTPNMVSASYSNVQPSTSVSSLLQQEHINLTGEFSITIELYAIPEIGVGGNKQYLLYRSNGHQDLKLFLANDSYTDGVDKICFQKESLAVMGSKQCIDKTTEITLSRDSENFIFLNGQSTDLKLTGNYGGSLTVGNNVGFLPLSTDSRGVKSVLFTQ